MGTYSWETSTPSGSSYSWEKPKKPSSSTSSSSSSSSSKPVSVGRFGSVPGATVATHIEQATGSILGNAFRQTGEIIHGIPSAAAAFPGDVKHTWDVGLTQNLGTPWDEYLPFYHKGEKPDPHNIVQQQTRAISKDIVALRRGDWSYFEKNPLNPVLDVASVASVGGKAALIGANRGALGARAAEFARTERTLTVGEHSEVLTASRTLQGRIRQSIFDKYSMANPDTPVIGANVRMQKILSKRAATSSLRSGLTARQFEQATNGLDPAEVFAFHVAAEGVPLDDRILYYQAQLAERTAETGGKAKITRPLEQYLGSLQAPVVREALDNPRPEFITALQAGKELEGKAGTRLVETGLLSPETRTERAALPQREMLGAAGESAPAELGTNLVNPAFPAPYRFPHVGTRKSQASFYRAPGTHQMLGKARTLDQLKHNAGIRLRNALFLTDPHKVLTTDFLQTARHEEIIQMQKEALDPISQPLSEAHVGAGFKQEGEWYYRPSYDRKVTAPIDKAVREMEPLVQDQALLHSELRKGKLEDVSGSVVSKNLRDLGVDERDLHNLEKLNELGVRRVPGAFGKDFNKEYVRTHWAVRHFIDRPLDVWRMITLNYRPAWMVNNFVGNALMGFARYGPEGAARYLQVLLSTERGEAKVRQLFGFTMNHPTIRRKYGHVFDEVAPELHSAGLYGTQTRITHPGVYEGKLAGFTANPAVKALGFAPKQVWKVVKGVGHGVTKVELLLAENTSREAAFITEAGGDLEKIRATARKMGEGNLSLAEALQRLDKSSTERAVRGVNDALGDFRDLSPFERSVVRRMIPFYSWFKVIAKVSGKYAARYPARILLLKNMEEAKSTKGETPLPSWLAGAIRLGKPSGGVQSVLSTQGINPYETIPQTLESGPGGMLNPFLQAGIVGATGNDPTFGPNQRYYGFGATERGGFSGFGQRAGGKFIEGLAPARLYSQTTQPYKGHAYAPRAYGHVGPVTINDFLLQYLGLPLRHVRTGG